MIFPNDIARAILTGRITQARIVAKTDECPRKPGRSYTITRFATAHEREQHGRYITVGRLRVISVRHQELGDAEWEADVARECLDFDDWIAYWEKKEKRDFGALRHLPTWVIEFELDQDRPRLLAADSSKGYTDKPYLALSEEPESVDEATLTDLTTRAGHRFDKLIALRQKEARTVRSLLTVEERMRRAHAAARMNNIDVSNEMHAMRQMLRRNAPIDNKLGVVERLVYREAA